MLVVPTYYVCDAAALQGTDDGHLLQRMLKEATDIMRTAIGARFEEGELLMGFHWPPRVTVKWLHLHVLYPKVLRCT